MMDISGTWYYNEDFIFGKDKGFIVFKQEGLDFKGEMHYVESIQDEQDFTICQIVEGSILDDNISIKGVDYIAQSDYEDVEYQLDNLKGEIISDSLIVGVSHDAQGIGGVFVLQR